MPQYILKLAENDASGAREIELSAGDACGPMNFLERHDIRQPVELWCGSTPLCRLERLSSGVWVVTQPKAEPRDAEPVPRKPRRDPRNERSSRVPGSGKPAMLYRPKVISAHTGR